MLSQIAPHFIYNTLTTIQGLCDKDPALTLQPIVENAVKHGLCKKDGGGTVWIHAYETDGINQIVVGDDGAGFEAELRAVLWKNAESEKSVSSYLQKLKKNLVKIIMII